MKPLQAPTHACSSGQPSAGLSVSERGVAQRLTLPAAPQQKIHKSIPCMACAAQAQAGQLTALPRTLVTCQRLSFRVTARLAYSSAASSVQLVHREACWEAHSAHRRGPLDD